MSIFFISQSSISYSFHVLCFPCNLFFYVFNYLNCNYFIFFFRVSSSYSIFMEPQPSILFWLISLTHLKFWWRAHFHQWCYMCEIFNGLHCVGVLSSVSFVSIISAERPLSRSIFMVISECKGFQDLFNVYI